MKEQTPDNQNTREEIDLQKINFFDRLKSFVSNVQVNDMMSEEEKGMILHVCDNYSLSTQTKEQGVQLFSEAQMYQCALQFFYHWFNSKGNNTAQGLQEWLPTFIASLPQSTGVPAGEPQPYKIKQSK